MAWIYFQALVESDQHSSLGLEQSPIVSATDTLKPFYCPECDQVTLTPLQSGMMCKHSQAISSPESTSSMAASPAKTSLLQELAEAWKATEAAYSSRLSGLQKKLSLRFYSSKTCQPLEPAAFDKSQEHLPKWGMIVGGLVYLPQALEPTTSAKDGSYWPTPSASSYGSNKGGAAGRVGKERYSLETMARRNLWPTPRASDARGPGWRTNQAKGQNLPQMVKLWPTPCARDYRTGDRQDSIRSQTREHSPNLNDVAAPGGQLNPQWVEWLMGYPIGWTELDALEMQWFRCKRGKHSKDLWGSKRE